VLFCLTCITVPLAPVPNTSKTKKLWLASASAPDKMTGDKLTVQSKIPYWVDSNYLNLREAFRAYGFFLNLTLLLAL